MALRFSAAGFAGTPGYLSPEVLRKDPYGKPVDIWACGKPIPHTQLVDVMGPWLPTMTKKALLFLLNTASVCCM